MKKLRYRMSPHCVPVCVMLLLMSGLLEAKLRYAFIFPNALQSEHPELACLHMEGMQGLGQLQVFLISRSTKLLVERTFPENPVFTCLPITVPKLPADHIVNMFGPENIELEVVIKNSGEIIREKRTVTLKPKKMSAAPQILIQTDKSVYKPGQTVKFRIVSLNANFEPADTKIALVELQDPKSNRIGQWLDVKLNKGMADLSHSMSSEPQLGEYSIIMKSKVHKFSVEEYVLPRFEVIFELPQFLLTNKETFPVKICARYTFGKPVPGQYKGNLCRRKMFGFATPYSTQRPACVRFKGELDKLGCAKLTMKSYNFYLQHPTHTMLMSIQGEVTVTEEGTGIELSASGESRITTMNHLLAFPNAKKMYRPGIPYSGTVEVLNEQRMPVPAQKVYLTCRDGNTTSKHTLITDGNGRAAFKLNNTKNWVDNVHLTGVPSEIR